MKNDNKQSFELREDGIYINHDGQEFKVSYEERHLPFAEAEKWCIEQGGSLPTFDQGIIINALRDDINIELEKHGKETILGWYWLNKTNPKYTNCAYLVDMDGGGVLYTNEDDDYYVRAVSAL